MYVSKTKQQFPTLIELLLDNKEPVKYSRMKKHVNNNWRYRRNRGGRVKSQTSEDMQLKLNL